MMTGRGQRGVKIYPATLQQSAPAPTILTQCDWCGCRSRVLPHRGAVAIKHLYKIHQIQMLWLKYQEWLKFMCFQQEKCYFEVKLHFNGLKKKLFYHCNFISSNAISSRLKFQTGSVSSMSPNQDKERERMEVEESVAAMLWCAIVLSYLIPFRNLLDGRRERKRR